MLKNAYFLKKKTENRRSSVAPLLNPFLPKANARIVTPAYDYNFIQFVFSAKFDLLLSKKNKIITVIVLILLLPLFCIYFSLQTL